MRPDHVGRFSTEPFARCQRSEKVLVGMARTQRDVRQLNSVFKRFRRWPQNLLESTLPGDDPGFLGARQRLETPPAWTVIVKSFDPARGNALPPIARGGTFWVPWRAALLDLPSAAPTTIRARKAMRCSVWPERAIRSSSCLCSGVTANAAPFAPMPRRMACANHIVKRYVQHDTRP
jgi:hypothetical protein